MINSPKKILIAFPYFLPSQGGVEQVISNLSDGLQNMGWDVTIACRPHPERTSSIINGAAIVEFDIKGCSSRGFQGPTESFVNFLCREKFDIIYTIGTSTWPSELIGLNSSIIPGIKIWVPTGYYNIHNSNYWEFYRNLPNFLTAFDAIIQLSDDYRDARLHSIFSLSSNYTIPNGVDPLLFLKNGDDFRTKYNIPIDKKIILNVSNHFFNKGHKKIIDAFQKSKLDDYCLIIIGNPATYGQQECYNDCTQHRAPNVYMLSGVSRDYVIKAFTSANIFILASEYECFPIVLLEAMASGTPFISTDAGNAKELSGGLIYDVDNLHTGLQLLAQDDKLYSQLKENCFEEIKTKYTLEIVTSMHEQLFNTLMQRKTIQKIIKINEETCLHVALKYCKEKKYDDGLWIAFYAQKLIHNNQKFSDLKNIAQTLTKQIDQKEAYFKSAKICFSQSDLENAFLFYQLALEIDPLYVPAIKAMRNLEQNMGSSWKKFIENYVINKITASNPSQPLLGCQIFDSKKTMESIIKILKNESSEEVIHEDLVSVIIPCYNEEDNIKQTILSVINQSYKNIEIIIVNDGSTDNTQQIILDTIHQHKNINIKIIYQNNRGLSSARNTGSKIAKGKYFFYLDGNDEILANCIAELHAILHNNKEISWAYPITIQIGEINRFWSYKEFSVHENLTKNLQPCSSLIRSTLFYDVGGFDESMRLGYEDWNFWVSAIRKGHCGKLCRKILFIYKKNKTSMLYMQRAAQKEFVAKCQLISNNKECYIPIHDSEILALKTKLRIPEKLINPNFIPTSISTSQNTTLKLRTNSLVKFESQNIKELCSLTVQFYVYKNVHWPMFESLFEYLRGRKDVREIVICLPNLPNLTNSGTNHHLVEKILTLSARIVTDPRKANADVTFIADTIAGKVHGCGRIVNVGHGTISKGYYFTESVWTERENWVDLLCVPGEYARERMSAILKTKVVATGMPKLDPVFSGRHTKNALCSALGLDPRKKIVLYAPTFNLSLSSAFVFANSFHLLDSPDRYLLIKLHGSTLPNLIEQYRRIAKNSRQIIFVEDNNIAPYIGGADIMISDVSSAFMEFMALNKPVILYDNPGWSSYHGYDPENIEYAWRDLGTRINSFEELPAVLDRLMVHSDGKELIRQKYAAQLFADKSGRACENVWQETLRLTHSPAGNPLPVFSVVIPVEQDAHILLRSLIHDLQFYSVMPMELILIATGGSLPEGFVNPLVQFNEFINVKLIGAPRNTTAEEAVSLGVNASSGDFICVLREDVALFKNFDYMLYKTFKAHPEVAVLTGLTNLPLPDINSNRYLANERSESPDCLAYRFINQFKGTEIASLGDQPSIPPLVVFRKESINLSAGAPLPALQSLIAHGKAAICLSLFYLSLDPAFRASLLKVWRMRSLFNDQDRLKIMSDVVSHLSCPDMSEVMVRDAMTLALPKSQYRQGIANSLHTRYYDTEHKAWLSSILDANDPWAKSLQADCRIIDALKAATRNPGSIEHGQNKTRVMFYFFKNVHIPILFPLYHALKAQNAKVEIGFSYLPPSPQIRAGLLADEVRIIEQAGVPIHATPQEFKPDLTFIADSVYPWVEDCGKLVHVGHGVLSKGQYYTDTPTARREELADLICVPGKHHQAIMRRIISKPVVATGMCKLDDLFAGRVNRASVLKQYGLPADYRYVLFAPTFNDELSAIPVVQEHIGKVLPDDKTLLIIKLHPSTKAEYKEMYRALPNRDKRIIFADELDITPFLALCDVMISDVSSAMMEFAALDKPVILFNNPNWTSYQNFNPADIEFQWRDIGVQVTNLDEMREAVSLCLQTPGLHADKRKKYTDLLFANKRDGNAAQRIVKLALSLLQTEQKR